ncbi:uncharacterized protein [Bemisia tabaci]|uniref:uncharacterized protein n=1 Tax=Bemisia tabaci TaxID=7038 RepID=UPI003B285D2E
MPWQKPKPPVPEEFKGGAEECNAKCQNGEGHIIIHPGADLKGEGNTSHPALNPKGGGHTHTIPPGASPKGDGHAILDPTVLQPHAANAKANTNKPGAADADKVMYIATGVVKKWVAEEAEYDTCKCVVNEELIEHLKASGLPATEFATAFEKGPESGRVWLTMHNIRVSYHRPAWVDELPEKRKRAQEEKQRQAQERKLAEEERKLAEEKSKKKRHRFFRFGLGHKSRRR